MSKTAKKTNRTALITGITGQDGSYLAELLLEKGYTVHGIKRRASSFNTERIDHIYQGPQEKGRRLHLHYGDLADSGNLVRIVQEVQPDEIYNLGAMSHVAVSFAQPEYTADIDGLAKGNFLYLKRGGGTNDLGRGNAYDLVVVPHDKTNPGMCAVLQLDLSHGVTVCSSCGVCF